MTTVKEETLSPGETCFDFCNNNDDNEGSRKYSCSSNDSTSTNCSEFSSFDMLLQTKDQLRRNYYQNALSNEVDLKFSENQNSKVQIILDSVKSLSESERVLFYMKLPLSGYQQSTSLTTSKWEQTQAFQWIRNNLEECDNTVNLPKHEVYDDYKLHCENQGTKRVLSAPDFGKIVKCMFPNVKARRLGTRGNSKYCYNGLRRKNSSPVPEASESSSDSSQSCNVENTSSFSNNEEDSVDQVFTAACKVVCEWANKLLGRCFNTLIELAKFLVNGSYVSTKSMAAFMVMSATDEVIEKINQKYNLKNLSSSKSQSTKTVTTTSKGSNNRTSSLPNGICTPSKTVRGITNNSKNVNNSSPPTFSSVSSSQIVPVTKSCYSENTSDPTCNGYDKVDDVDINQFSIDVNAPVFLEQSASLLGKSKNGNEYTLNGVSVVVKEEPTDSVFFENPVPTNPVYHPTTPPLTLKREEKRKKKIQQQLTTVVPSPTAMKHQPQQQFQQHLHNIQYSLTTTEQRKPKQSPPPKSPVKTPKKVGRPKKSSQPASPYSPRSAKKYTIASPKCQPSPIQHMVPPPSPIQGFHNRFSSWQMIPLSPQQQSKEQQQQQKIFLQQQQQATRSGIPCDAELKNIFLMNCPQTPPNHHMYNNNQISIPQNNGMIRSSYQSLTPQMNSSNHFLPSEDRTFHAKRNLTSLFDESTKAIPQSPNQMIPNSSMMFNQDRIVPRSASLHNVAVHQQQQPGQPQYQRKTTDTNELYDLGFTLNDLSTPEEMGDIPSGLENIDGDDLIKSLQNPNHNWANDWSTSTVPLMNIS